jgi:site-specific recombinase XerD
MESPTQLLLWTDQAPRQIGPTTAANVGAFLQHCRVAKSLSACTLRAYRSDLADFERLIGSGTTISEVDRDRIRSYVRVLLDRGLKQTTIKRRVATLKVFFRWLEHEGLLPLSVFHRLDLSIRLPRRLPRALDPEDMRRLLRAAGSRVRRAAARTSYDDLLGHFLVVALFTTGLRVGELVSINIADVSVRESAIQVRGKGNRERRVYLPGRLAILALGRFLAARRTIRTSHDSLFVGASGIAITAQHVRNRLASLGVAAGIVHRVTPHMLRHTAATQLLEAGVDIRFVQKLLGHSSIATTQIYTHVRDVALKAKLARANTLARLSRRVG